MIKLAIFASGRGSNALNIIKEFENDPYISVSLICSNRSKAGVLELATAFNITQLYLSKKILDSKEQLLDQMNKHQIDLIILAGFLKLIPPALIHAYPKKILNIHPALLPKFGGKGMYGMNVHKAVKEAQEKYSGLTIHLVNEKYDEGAYLFKASCKIEINWSPEEIAKQVLKFEHLHYAKIIRQYCQKFIK